MIARNRANRGEKGRKPFVSCPSRIRAFVPLPHLIIAGWAVPGVPKSRNYPETRTFPLLFMTSICKFGFSLRALSIALSFPKSLRSCSSMAMRLSAVSAVLRDLAFRYFMLHGFTSFRFASGVGRLACQPCCSPLHLLQLQPIKNMFGVRLCAVPPLF